MQRGADLTGLTIGSFEVLGITCEGKEYGRRYRTRCKCGREYEHRSTRLRYYLARGTDWVCIECHSKVAGRKRNV
jgi:hypothetical protein